MRRLIDPRLRSSISDAHAPSRCTVQTITYTNSASNQPIPTGAVDLAGVVNVECSLGALIRLRPTDTQVRTGGVEDVRTLRQCRLNGYFPVVVPGMQAVVDSVIYPIIGVDCDSLRFSTRLRLEIIEP